MVSISKYVDVKILKRDIDGLPTHGLYIEYTKNNEQVLKIIKDDRKSPFEVLHTEVNKLGQYKILTLGYLKGLSNNIK